jgi:FkbM family methyltransferase
MFKLLQFFTNQIGYRLEVIDKKFIYRVDIKYNKNKPKIFETLFDDIITNQNEGFKYNPNILDSFGFIYYYREIVDKLYDVYNILGDEISREVYYNVIKYRLTYALQRTEPIIFPSTTLSKPKYPFPILKGPDSDFLILNTYIHSQYEIPGIFEAFPGDIVFDIGGYTGDTALYFSSAVKSDGLVYTFEPNKQLINLLKINIKLNKRENIVIIEKGLFDKTVNLQTQKKIEMLNLNDLTLNTQIDLKHDISDAKSVIELISFDDFVSENDINKISLIKMDIEGAEELALKGAKNTIAKFKPKLAISIYHRYFDLYNLPLLIHSYQPNYKFYLRHTTNLICDTILFCL